MNNHTKEQLALFGKNRYHDWVVLFFMAVIAILVGAAVNVWLYMSTEAVMRGTNEVETVASKFESFKRDVEYISAYIESGVKVSTSTAPRDPSLR
jgi:hypothetical protein